MERRFFNRDFHERYSVFFEVRADLAWVARNAGGTE